MITQIRQYTNWLHGQWPAGHVERLPMVNDDGSTNVSGLYVVGDITGIPLLKFASNTGAMAVQIITADSTFQQRDQNAVVEGNSVHDLIIVGGGVSGMAAALEARKHHLRFEIFEAAQPFSTIVNFPKGKPIFTYPTDMIPAGDLQFSDKANVKEALVEELVQQTIEAGIQPLQSRVERVIRKGKIFEVVTPQSDDENKKLFAHRIIVAVGRSGNFRKLGVPGEDRDIVFNRLHDPKDFCQKKVVVVGGGDSALEAAIAIASCGGHVTVSYRKPQFNRPKPDNIEKINELMADPMADVSIKEPVSERVTTSTGAYLNEHRKPGSIKLMMNSKVKEIKEQETIITNSDGLDETIPHHAVFAMIGREPPLGFFRRSGVHIHGEWRKSTYVGFASFLIFCILLYSWKGGGFVQYYFSGKGWFPFNVPDLFDVLSDSIAIKADQTTHFLYTLKKSMSQPNFYYAFAYCACVVVFGIRRIRRRKTPYIKAQTLTLMAIQCVPMFLLPELLLPWAGHNEWFADGRSLAWWADQFFERYDSIGIERAYWRSYGFILAWPLFVGNVCTDQPLWGWWIVGFVQTFMLIPGMIYFWGKGAYCGWICSCGALAETLGDTHRQKMPHGPGWNRVNLVGQVILVVAILIIFLRILGWTWPNSVWVSIYNGFSSGIPFLNYKWLVDTMLAGVIGLGFYFWFSGRMWCRFACPLAALMNIYARFSRFRIFSDKKKCISCNVCTSVCHQGIDVMNFANKGMPMEDPQCVRCSACVQSCPTGVLTFGQIDRRTGNVIRTDSLAASPVQMAELTLYGHKIIS